MDGPQCTIPKYSGPYIVLRATSRGNTVVIDASDTILIKLYHNISLALIQLINIRHLLDITHLSKKPNSLYRKKYGRKSSN